MSRAIDLRPVTRDEARAFVREHHRHHGVPVGWLWLHGLHDEDGELCGVAVVGRPVARPLDDGLTSEVTRCCTDTSPNAPSMLYAATEKASRAKGYRRGLTYLLASEWDRFEHRETGERRERAADDADDAPWDALAVDPDWKRIGGASVRACQWRQLWRVKGRSWDTPSRPRTDKHPTEGKVAVGWGERFEQEPTRTSSNKEETGA